MQSLHVIGGLRHGKQNATWPYAELSVTASALVITIAKLSISYSFAPTQVEAIKSYFLIPIIGTGIEVDHRVPGYPSPIIFWCIRPKRLIRGVRDVGFIPSVATAVPHDTELFDVFLCHNTKDKARVREINRYLKDAGLTTWLDEEQLPLGKPWQVEIERRISDIRTAAVFVGASGIGPWQDMEIRAFLAEFVQRGIPVIPVILPSASQVPELPIFLRSMTWADLRSDPSRGLVKLTDSIKDYAKKA